MSTYNMFLSRNKKILCGYRLSSVAVHIAKGDNICKTGKCLQYFKPFKMGLALKEIISSQRYCLCSSSIYLFSYH